MSRVSIPSAPLLTLRRDLLFTRQRLQGQTVWQIKDPVALRYYHFDPREYAICEMLDGQADAETILREYRRRFAPERLSRAELERFIARLHGWGLLLSHSTGQGDRLLERRRRTARSRIAAALTNPLAIQLPGIDPQWLLSRLYPKVRWMFSPAAITIFAIFVASTFLMAAVRVDELRLRLPALAEVFSGANLFWLAAAVSLAKILHELSHALACRHFGGHCSEIGLMLLAFCPCLYCNVSDAWTLPTKWPRIAIASAGVGAELLLAAGATVVWWLTYPSPLKSLALATMIVCSVGTLLVNGNPLLRYDAYYVLSDLAGIPNLWAQSRRRVWQALARCITTASAGDHLASTSLRDRWILWLYAPLSGVYRAAMIVGILWLVHRLLAPRGLAPLAWLITCCVAWGAVAPGAKQAAALLRDPTAARRLRRLPCSMAVAALLALLAVAALVPLPFCIRVPGTVDHAHPRQIYVAVAGRVVDALPPATPVTAAQVIARLENREIQGELRRLETECALLEESLEGLLARQTVDPLVGPRIPAARMALHGAQQRLKVLRQDADRLVLRAPVDGTFFPPPRRTADPSSGPDRLPTWSGLPTDPHNNRCYLEAGTLFGLVGQPDRAIATLHIDQSAVESVREGQDVRLLLYPYPDHPLTGKVVRVSKKVRRADSPVSALNGVETPGSRSPSVDGVPQVTYEALVRITSDAPYPVPSAARAVARIHVDPQTIFERLRGWLKNTVRY